MKKKTIEYLNKISVSISLAIAFITLIGYIFNITVICSSLLMLDKICIQTDIKLVVYYATKIYRKNVNYKMYIIIDESLI